MGCASLSVDVHVDVFSHCNFFYVRCQVWYQGCLPLPGSSSVEFNIFSMLSSLSQFEGLRLLRRVPFVCGFLINMLSFYFDLPPLKGLAFGRPTLFDLQRVFVIRRSVVFISSIFVLAKSPISVSFIPLPSFLHMFVLLWSLYQFPGLVRFVNLVSLPFLSCQCLLRHRSWVLSKAQLQLFVYHDFQQRAWLIGFRFHEVTLSGFIVEVCLKADGVKQLV